ncbi:glutamate-ammonia-ligase adenylyltransferase [Loktanella sp. 3ANDIMAR09]|uniref:[protein-PII] uridylyltransferase family protein n=1 Tax=Loktanella sp. 3ANDIMAR09 TaxID=1225657 RepID=UPI0006F27F03|nr:[glutamate--ammonia-ligase] adenylyltransferase [Loktanella sp. 3ANDIMAR09]KQI69679.1 glutamate-ammonia-ligase adenylyltransferase [Loktanella sp. 3ANDIMAR09]
MTADPVPSTGRLGDRIIRVPRAHDAARGADALERLPDATGPFRDLIAGTAGCSPYLAGLIAREADWLPGAEAAPEQALADTLTAVASLSLSDLPDGLRQAKRRVALLTALADLGGVWSLGQVTQALTDLAATATHAALVALTEAEIARGKLPGLTADDAATAGGMTALAMGKMGAGELNYSSDIDLICLFDETRFAPEDVAEARAGFVRVTRRMCAMMSDVTAGGYVFRTDLRLRPDASVTPVCIAMDTAERYYESVGRTWERAAYIKAHPCAGDIAAGHRFLQTLRPFVWRRHLDFAAIQDAHDMRLRIRDHKGLHGPLTLPGHNMKLGRGGIREIEFFTQTRQLIAGGRDPGLRVRGTLAGLAALADAGWIPDDVRDQLSDHYTFHRTVEHRLQMVQDAQTHALPNDGDGFARLAAMMDRDVDDLRRDLTERLESVHDLTEGFFAPDTPEPAPEWGDQLTARWLDYPALRSARAVEIFRRVRPVILRRLQDAARPEEALAQFDTFLAGLPAGVQLFSLFDANPQLTQLIVDICATAPALAQYLSRNAGVLDAVIGGDFFAPWPGQDALTQGLSDDLAQAQDYEAALSRARLWTRERHFRIGVHHLRGLIDAPTSGAQYADLAGAVVTALWPVVCAEFARKHGTVAGRGAVVVAMGSLGAGRLNAQSDLDLIVIYDADGDAMSDGKRPLPARTYYARLTQALVTALSAPMGDGRLYEVDMRLRPSGRKGPVATSWTAFQAYQTQDAWTWEHLALTRARVIAGPADLAHGVETFRRDLLRTKGQGKTVLVDVADMRRRLEEAKPTGAVWDAKNGAGRLMDSDLAAQTIALLAGAPARAAPDQIDAGRSLAGVSDATITDLCAAQDLFWSLQAAARLLTGAILDPDALGEGGRRFVLREVGCDDLDALADRIATVSRAADAAFARLLEGPR